jgi:hypothetical protein
MNTIINKLPQDIVLRIIPYTYSVQNKDLLQDIINYKKMKKLLSKRYFNFWIIKLENNEPEDKNWMINDLISFANDDNATMLGYVDKFYNIFKRNIQLQSKSKDIIDKYFYHLEKKDVNTQINICIGLLRPDERERFFNLFNSYDYFEIGI